MKRYTKFASFSNLIIYSSFHLFEPHQPGLALLNPYSVVYLPESICNLGYSIEAIMQGLLPFSSEANL
jgi:hypothetical protein